MKINSLALSLFVLVFSTSAKADWMQMIGDGVGTGQYSSSACNQSIVNAEDNMGSCIGTISDESCSSTAYGPDENGLYSCSSRCMAACNY